jgi:hypothetical protein
VTLSHVNLSSVQQSTFPSTDLILHFPFSLSNTNTLSNPNPHIPAAFTAVSFKASEQITTFPSPCFICLANSLAVSAWLAQEKMPPAAMVP